MAFTFGLGITPMFPLRFGAASATIEHASPPALIEAIAKFGVTHLGTAPTAYKAMLSQPTLDEALKTLRYCISAGEHLPQATWRAWKERTGIAITDGIGSTEMMHIFVSAAGDSIRPGATGKAVPGYIATVLDADGYYWYLARSDDMIVSSGYNIGAPEVENALLSHPAVAECAVIGAPCPERGQKVKAFVVLAAGINASGELITDLQAHAKAEIAPYKYPREIEFVDALPKTATGKLRRSELRTND
jgi:2-aminobenzoate-CoA ligase